MVARTTWELAGTLRCQGTLQVNAAFSRDCSRIVADLEKDFEKNHSLKYFKHL